MNRVVTTPLQLIVGSRFTSAGYAIDQEILHTHASFLKRVDNASRPFHLYEGLVNNAAIH